MKKKLMMIWILLFGVQTTLQATWLHDMQLYFAIARYVVMQKIKSINPFGKGVSSLNYEDDDFLDDDFSFEPDPVVTPTFKKYPTKNGKLVLPTITAAMRNKLQKLKKI